MPRRKEEEAIDQVLDTLYALDIQGYVLDEKILKVEAKKRIKRTLSRLDKDRRKAVEDETRYRLKEFERFTQMRRGEREEIVRIAKERHISIEEAYRAAAGENV